MPLRDQVAAIARIPAEDLQPIYEAVQNCKECELRLNSLQVQLAATKSKLEATEQERNAALLAAKGGSRWTRSKRALKWFAIGAAAGFLASRKLI